jgi:hypothetical protein
LKNPKRLCAAANPVGTSRRPVLAFVRRVTERLSENW